MLKTMGIRLAEGFKMGVWSGSIQNGGDWGIDGASGLIWDFFCLGFLGERLEKEDKETRGELFCFCLENFGERKTNKTAGEKERERDAATSSSSVNCTSCDVCYNIGCYHAPVIQKRFTPAFALVISVDTRRYNSQIEIDFFSSLNLQYLVKISSKFIFWKFLNGENELLELCCFHGTYGGF